MRNPFKWSLRSNEYLTLAVRIRELEDNVGKLTKLAERQDARARQQQHRAAVEPGPAVAPAFSAPVRGAAPCADCGPSVESGGGADRSVVREQLRALAKQRGLT